MVFIIRHDDPGDSAVIYATADANDAIRHSQALAKDQYGHTVEAWHGAQKLGTINLQLIGG